MPLWFSSYWLRFRVWLGVAPDSSRPNWGALVMLLGIGLVAMRWTPIEAPPGAPWWEFYMVNAEAMAKSVATFAARFDQIAGGALILLGIKMGQSPTREGTSFTVAVGESLKKIETIANGHTAPPAPPAGG